MITLDVNENEGEVGVAEIEESAMIPTPIAMAMIAAIKPIIISEIARFCLCGSFSFIGELEKSTRYL